MKRAALCCVAAALGLVPASAWPQITFSNLLEGRVGKDPQDPRPAVPDDRATFFDQFHLDWARDALLLGFRFEHYVASEDASLGYSEFVQRYAAWQDRGLEVRVGNFQALFGRGLVLRAFELPGVVREEQFRQFGYSRDLDGGQVRYRRGSLDLMALTGQPRRADEPPGTERRGLASGAQAAGQLVKGLRLGGEYLRLDPQDGGPTTHIPGGFAQVAFEPWLSRLGLRALTLGAYGEYAHAIDLDPSASVSPDVDPDEGRALYVGTDVSLPLLLPGLRAAASWEYKDYDNFALPGTVNEPPTLVREHTMALLNRSTHVLEPAQEEGYQFEARLDWRQRADLTLNWSRAENSDSRRFEEFFAELAGHRGLFTLSLFADLAEDGSAIPPVRERETYGTYAVVPLHGDHSLEIELARMRGSRDSSPADIPFEDRYASLTWAWAERISLGVVTTSTDDPGDPGAGEPDPSTGRYPRQDFTSVGARLRLARHHDLLGFWGKRRGGIACTAGTCYVVPAFDGASLQLLTRF